MVYMAHHCNDRCTEFQIRFIIFHFTDCFRDLSADIFCLISAFTGNDIDCLRIQTLIDRYHNTQIHTGCDNLIDLRVHHGSQLADGNKLGKFQDFALCLLLLHLLVQFFLNSITFLLTVFSAFLVLTFASKTCESLLYLLCYILFIYFYRTLIIMLLITFAIIVVGIVPIRIIIAVTITAIIIVVAVTIASVVITVAVVLTYSSIDIHALLIDTLAFSALAIGIVGIIPVRVIAVAHFVFAFLTALFLSLFLRTGALVQCRQVYLTKDIHLGSHFVFTLQREQFVFRDIAIRRFLFWCFYLRFLDRFGLLDRSRRLLLNRFRLLSGLRFLRLCLLRLNRFGLLGWFYRLGLLMFFAFHYGLLYRFCLFILRITMLSHWLLCRFFRLLAYGRSMMLWSRLTILGNRWFSHWFLAQIIQVYLTDKLWVLETFACEPIKCGLINAERDKMGHDSSSKFRLSISNKSMLDCHKLATVPTS